MTDLLTENARLRAAIERIGELNMLPPDENGHRWWSSDLIGQEVDAALATPAPDAVQEAARVLLDALGRAQIDMAILKMFYNGEPNTALRAIAGDRT